jgi:hypothetical protein
MESERLMDEAMRKEAAARKRKANKAKSKKPDMWARLVRLISAYTTAAIEEPWKGGGDPEEFETKELRLALARAELNTHLAQMKRELT